MSTVGKCSFYRSPQTLAIGRGLGYCDLQGDPTICDGDVQFCKDREALRKQILDQKSKEGSNNKELESTQFFRQDSLILPSFASLIFICEC